jgi:hypothetical protein
MAQSMVVYFDDHREERLAQSSVPAAAGGGVPFPEELDMANSINGMAERFPTPEDHHPYHNTTLYGAAKVFKSQFPDPPASRLLEPLGEMSPMGLLWSFMGASEAYTVFGGLAETIPAILLMFGRTTLLGALAAALPTGSKISAFPSGDVADFLFGL